MIPHQPDNNKRQATVRDCGPAVLVSKERTVHPSQQLASEPPLGDEQSFATKAFGYATGRYWAFLEALLDGLMEYEVTKGDHEHAPSPVPVA